MVLAYFSASAPYLPAQDSAQLRDIAAKLVADEGLPAVWLAVMRDDNELTIGCAGVRKIGSDEPVTESDRVHLGSCTKAFTAGLLAKIVADGDLDWDLTVAKAFPDWTGEIREEYASVTLSQLLAHRGGLRANPPSWWLRGDDLIDARARILLSALKQKPAAEAGDRFVYSNSGYALAAHMAERRFHKTWESLMRDRLFDPLGMTTAGSGSPNTADQIDQPWGHHERGGLLTKRVLAPTQTDNAPALGPAGTIHCSIADWARFLDVHLHPDAHASWLDPKLVRELQTPLPAAPGERPYAGGWLVLTDPSSNESALVHSGSNTAWLATVQLIPARGVGLIGVTNLGGSRAEEAIRHALGEVRQMAIGADSGR